MIMVDFIFEFVLFIVQLLIVCGVFTVLFYVGKSAHNWIKSKDKFQSSRILNPQEYLPEEEIHTIRQVFYLAMILIFSMNILYLLFSWRENSFNLLLFDIIVSLYLAIRIDGSSSKNRIILFALIPFGSLAYLMFGDSSVFWLDFFHFIVFLYFIKQYFSKFTEYTETNSLGITIMLLFLIIFVSFFVTILVEGVSPINSIVMVSNAFTSNGYAVLGKSGIGKIDSLVLVWSGFLLSSVGTATLTVAIVMRHVNEQFDNLEELVKKNRK